MSFLVLTYSIVSSAAAILSHLSDPKRAWKCFLTGRPRAMACISLRSETSSYNECHNTINAGFLTEKSVHERVVASSSEVNHVQPGICRDEPSGTIGRMMSSPIALCSANSIIDISPRGRSEGGKHAWSPHGPSVALKLSYSPPTKDESDFETEEELALNLAFNCLEGKKGETGGEPSEWDRLEMEM